jgi:enoyl-CoA hydratase
MILTGEPITAEEAWQWGLVNRVVPAEEVLPTALRLADAIATGPAVAVRLAKESVLQAFESPLATGLLHERRLFAALFGTEDQREGVQAFLDKRPPRFQGR